MDPARAKKIEQYEASRDSFSIGTWILGLGVVAIGIGVIALIASNWDGISPGLKIACDLVILIALAGAVLRTQGKKSKVMQSELCIGLLFFFTLASMALVGQIYQIDAPLPRTLLTWFLVTTPLLLLSQSSFLATVWALLGAVVFVMQLSPLEELLERAGMGEWFLVAYVWCGPLLFRWLGANTWFRNQFPDHGEALRGISDLATIVGAAMCTSVWYSSHGVHAGWRSGLIATTLVLGLAVVFRKSLWPDASSKVVTFKLGLWALAWLCLVMGLGISRGFDVPVIAAVFQLGMLAMMILIAIQAGSIRQVRFWVGAACLRLLIVYFEIFGSLLDTGIALVGGGILIVVLAGLWRKWASKLERNHATK